MPSSGGQKSALSDRKSTRLNSSHGSISHAVFCLKQKGCHDGWDLARVLAILPPCVDGGLYTLKDVQDAAGERLHPLKCTCSFFFSRRAPPWASILSPRGVLPI